MFKALFKWMEESGPIYLLPTGPVSSFLVISDPDAAKHVLQRSDNPKNNVYGKGLVAEVSEFLFGVGFATSGLPLFCSLTTSSELTAQCPPQLGMRNCQRAFLHPLPCGTSRFRPCPLGSGSHVDPSIDQAPNHGLHIFTPGELPTDTVPLRAMFLLACLACCQLCMIPNGQLATLTCPPRALKKKKRICLQHTCDAGDRHNSTNGCTSEICRHPSALRHRQLACLILHSKLVSGCLKRGVAGHAYHCVCSAKGANRLMQHVVSCAEHPATHV